MINLRQLYKWQEIIKANWIYRYYNLADFMTKAKLPPALKTLIYINCINISITKWVE